MKILRSKDIEREEGGKSNLVGRIKEERKEELAEERRAPLFEPPLRIR